MLLKSYIIYRYLESPKPQKPWKTKKKQSQKSWGRLGNQKNKTLRRMFGFDSKDFLFVFPRFCLFLVGFNSQPWVFLHTYYQPISQKTKKLKFFFGCVIFPFLVMVWYGFKSQKKMCFLFFAYMLSTNISKKTKKNSRCFSFVVMVWYGFKSQKQKKTWVLVFCIHAINDISKKQKKLMCFLFFCFCCYGLICYAVFDSKSTRHIA